MKRVGLRFYFIFSAVLFAVLFAIISQGLWRASEELEQTASKLHNAVESIMTAQNILDRLEVHRRQALHTLNFFTRPNF